MKNIDKVFEILEKRFESFRKPTVRRTSQENDPYKTLVACLLSLRTQDKNTEKAASSLFKIADTPKGISKIPLKKLEKLIFSSGYYRNKAKSIKHVTNVLLKEYNGKVPDTEEELLAIKGIGRKIANVVLSFAFNKLVIPVDVNVHRVSNRLGWVKTKNPDKTEEELKKIIPKKYWREINTLFIQFGKTICVPIFPFCSKCPIRKHCKRIGILKSR